MSVRIPATGTDSPLLHLGLRADGGLEVPPGEPGSPAAWYNQSPVPGEPGPAILLGHVNATDGGPGVFAGLRELDPGDTIEVARQDGTTAVFAVQRGVQYSKDNFDTQAVYGDTAGSRTTTWSTPSSSAEPATAASYPPRLTDAPRLG